jgi:uncharacterized protein YdeI (YjbR/CyaY-like superfamily)
MATPALVVFFDSPEAFRAWLAAHAPTATEIVVGYYKVGTGRPSMTWPASVDEALCVGWVDGVRKRIDEHAYQIRFTPRKPSSTWSAINIERVRVLSEAGRMTPSGIEAFARRREETSRTYAYEQAGALALAPADEALFRKNRTAWAFFEAQPPGYRKLVVWRILSAKQQATRDKRLAALIDASAKGQRLT